MSKLRRWLTGAEVMKRLDISRLDLLELVERGKLPAHEQLTGELLKIGNRPASFLPDDGFAGTPIKRVAGGYRFVQEHETRMAQVSPEEIEGCVFLIADMEALEKEQQKIKPRNEDKGDMVSNKTLLATVREVRLVLPYLEEAIKRKMFKPLLSWAKKSELSLPSTIFAPPASNEEAVIMILADMVVTLTDDPKNRIEPIISGALSEIDEAYDIVLQDGGGWSARKGGPERRQAAVLEWFDRNEARLSCLKKSHLEEPNLYNPGGGQEKRNFRIRLIMKIVEETAHQRITSKEAIDYLRQSKQYGETILGKVLSQF
jgi:hypothetical protein